MSSGRSIWQHPGMLLALVVIIVSIPIKLYSFIGFSLGDDPNYFVASLYAWHKGYLITENFFHYRPLSILPVWLSFQIFGPTEFAFVAPVFVASILTDLLIVAAAFILLGPWGACIAAVLSVTTPFMTWAGASFVPDAFLTVLVLASAVCLLLAERRSSRGTGAISGALFASGLLVKTSLLMFLPGLIVVFFSLRSKRGILTCFGLGAIAVFLLSCVWFFHWDGHPLRWLRYSVGGTTPPYDETKRIGEVLLEYPRYLFFAGRWGEWMFGGTGWLAALGTGLLVHRIIFRRVGRGEVFLSFWVISFLVLEFVPHRFTVDAYYSYFRNFRYLHNLAPGLVLLAAYFVCTLWKQNFLLGNAAAAAFGGTVMFNVLLFGPALRPSIDASAETRAIDKFAAAEKDFASETVVWASEPQCYRIETLLIKDRRKLRCNTFTQTELRKKFLESAGPGYVITGGVPMVYYPFGNVMLNMGELGVSPKENWELLYESPAMPELWRKERLRIWQVR